MTDFTPSRSPAARSETKAAWRTGTPPPVIGITPDVAVPPPASPSPAAATPGSPAAPAPQPSVQVSLAYALGVERAGGIPLILPPIPELAALLIRRCDAVILTGGNDPRTEPFGKPTHPAATLVHPQRQAFETAILRELDQLPHLPVLGICLGMQMMTLHHGGELNQHLPETHASAEQHRRATHTITLVDGDGSPATAVAARLAESYLRNSGSVLSNHHQAIARAGRLQAIAHAPDGVIEAVAHPERTFYLGVQWHPERTEDPNLGDNLFRKLVEAAIRARGAR